MSSEDTDDRRASDFGSRATSSSGVLAASVLGAVALFAVLVQMAASGTAGEHAVVTPRGVEASRAADLDKLQMLESKQGAEADQPSHVLALGDAYLGAHAPGLALRVVESSSAGVRANPGVEHLYARALFDEGRATESLAAERRVIARCTALGAAHPEIEGCDARTVMSASRRSEYLEKMLAMGVEDPSADPGASQIAYLATNREVRLATR